MCTGHGRSGQSMNNVSWVISGIHSLWPAHVRHPQTIMCKEWEIWLVQASLTAEWFVRSMTNVACQHVTSAECYAPLMRLGRCLLSLTNVAWPENICLGWCYLSLGDVYCPKDGHFPWLMCVVLPWLCMSFANIIFPKCTRLGWFNMEFAMANIT